MRFNRLVLWREMPQKDTIGMEEPTCRNCACRIQLESGNRVAGEVVALKGCLAQSRKNAFTAHRYPVHAHYSNERFTCCARANYTHAFPTTENKQTYA